MNVCCNLIYIYPFTLRRRGTVLRRVASTYDDNKGVIKM